MLVRGRFESRVCYYLEDIQIYVTSLSGLKMSLKVSSMRLARPYA